MFCGVTAAFAVFTAGKKHNSRKIIFPFILLTLK
jgi:hypothetical protein